MIVDVHAHYHPRAYTALLARFPGASIGQFGGVPEPDTDDEAHIAARLAMMAQAGVGLQVLSPAGGRAPYTTDGEAASAAARLCNDLTAQLVRRFPRQFQGWVNLPLPHIEPSLQELRRGLDELGLIGVTLHCSALDRSLAEEEFLPIYAELNQRHGIVFFHPCDNGIRSPLITDYGLNGAVGTSLEDAAIVLHLIANKIPAQFPAITFIVPHLGGPIPMLLDRLDRQAISPSCSTMSRTSAPSPGSARRGCRRRMSSRSWRRLLQSRCTSAVDPRGGVRVHPKPIALRTQAHLPGQPLHAGSGR
jgi:predicted TIM-barrel fold metal-dependent hydrolase